MHSIYICISGNDNIIEYNDIHDAVLWAGDAGAIYAYLWWDYRGNHIKYNFIHDIRTGFRSDSGESGVYDANGIYLDGSVPGFTVFGNILHNVQNRAIFANGGRDTVIQNNIVTNSGEIGIYGTTGGFRMTSEIMQRLIAMNYQQDPWASAYPKLAAIPSDWPDGSHWRYPAGTIVKNNIGFGNTRFLAEGNYDGTGVFNKYEEMSNNIKSTTPLYVNEAAGNFNLRKNSPAFKIPGFVDIPFDRIGIEPDHATPSKFSTRPPRKPTY